MLNYLYSKAKHPSFVEEELSLLYARLTKISWFDSNKEEWYFRNVLEDISKFLQVSNDGIEQFFCGQRSTVFC